MFRNWMPNTFTDYWNFFQWSFERYQNTDTKSGRTGVMFQLENIIFS